MRNQGGLAEELAVLKAVLRRHADSGGPETPECDGPIDILAGSSRTGEPTGTESTSGRIRPETGTSPVLDAFCDTFGLTPFERDIILLCAGIELDSAFAPLCGAAQGNPSRTYPTFSLALAALPEAH